jgi:hypothetical protein
MRLRRHVHRRFAGLRAKVRPASARLAGVVTRRLRMAHAPGTPAKPRRRGYHVHRRKGYHIHRKKGLHHPHKGSHKPRKKGYHVHRKKGYHVHRRKGLKHPHKGSHAPRPRRKGLKHPHKGYHGPRHRRTAVAKAAAKRTAAQTLSASSYLSMF